MPRIRTTHQKDRRMLASAPPTSTMPLKTRNQLRIPASTSSVRPGQTKAMIPAMIESAPPTRYSQRQLSTRPAVITWVMPVMRKVTPAKTASASRLPTLWTS